MTGLDEQIKELTKLVQDLRVDLATMNIKMDTFKDVKDKVDEHSVRLTSVEASASSAHKRMDRIEKIHAWIAMTAGGGIIVAGVTFMLKGGFMK